MSIGGCAAVVAVECTKLSAQIKTRVLFAACVAGPFAFAGALRLQSSVPADTLFGRSVKESGLAVPLVILGFAALWALPVLTSVVSGDLFSAEDRHGTWKMVLTRSRSRADLFAGKIVTALCVSVLAILALAASSVAAGVSVIGSGPLIGLSGSVLPPDQALGRVTLSWVSVVPPSFAFAALALLLSITSRSSVVGVGVPVILGLLMQLSAMIDGPEVIRRLLMTSAFSAWHGLLTDPPYYRPLVHGIAVSAAYFVACLVVAYRRLRLRDIA